MIDETGSFLSNEQIEKLCETKAGKEKVKQYLLRGRVAYTAQCVFEALDLVPSEQQQELVCEVFWRCMFNTPTANILAYIDSFKEHVDNNSVNGTYFPDDSAGNC